MTVEGPWIVGALDADYPDVQWQAAELPEGPAGKGTLTFSNCWGVAADGDTEGAVELVKHFTSRRGAAGVHRGVRRQPVARQPRGVERRGAAGEGGVQRRRRLRQGTAVAARLRLGEDRLQRPARGAGDRGGDARPRCSSACSRPPRKSSPISESASARRPQRALARRTPLTRQIDSASATAPGLPPARQPWHRRPSTREGIAGWLFVGPVVIVFLVFLVFPILMSLWVSLLDWNGQTNPLTEFDFVGLDNYRRLLTEDTPAPRGLRHQRAQHRVLRARVRAGRDGAGVPPRPGRQQPGAEGPRLLPHRLLLPVDHQLGGHQHHVPVPVPEHRRDQHDPRLVRHPRAGRGSPTPAG